MCILPSFADLSGEYLLIVLNYCYAKKHQTCKTLFILTNHVCWSKTKLQGAQSTGMLGTQVQLWLQFLLSLKKMKRSSYGPLWHLRNLAAAHIPKGTGRIWHWIHLQRSVSSFIFRRTFSPYKKSLLVKTWKAPSQQSNALYQQKPQVGLEAVIMTHQVILHFGQIWQ